MTYRSPRISNSDAGAVAAVGCLGCLIYVVYLIGVILFFAAVAWAVVSVLQWQGVL